MVFHVNKGEHMKKLSILLTIFIASQAQANDFPIEPIFPDTPIFGDLGNPELFPVEEDPGSNAEIIEKVVHSKTVYIDGSTVSHKWTMLGYGQTTEKIIVPDLANHTLFNHRNPGEEGPCLRSYNIFGQSQTPTIPDSFTIDITILNSFRVNRERGICQVNMVEDVITVIDGVEFTHRYSKDMGYRYIEDCL